MQNFNFDSIITTGSGIICSCLDNGAPVRPINPGDPGYPNDPENLYFWEYRSTIIISCSITNNNTKTVKSTINIVKPDPITIPIIYDIEIPAGGTVIVIGGSHKAFLEYEDELESFIKNADDEGLVTITTSIMNIYDFGHIPPIKV